MKKSEMDAIVKGMRFTLTGLEKKKNNGLEVVFIKKDKTEKDLYIVKADSGEKYSVSAKNLELIEEEEEAEEDEDEDEDATEDSDDDSDEDSDEDSDDEDDEDSDDDDDDSDDDEDEDEDDDADEDSDDDDDADEDSDDDDDADEDEDSDDDDPDLEVDDEDEDDEDEDDDDDDDDDDEEEEEKPKKKDKGKKDKTEKGKKDKTEKGKKDKTEKGKKAKMEKVKKGTEVECDCCEATFDPKSEDGFVYTEKKQGYNACESCVVAHAHPRGVKVFRPQKGETWKLAHCSDANDEGKKVTIKKYTKPDSYLVEDKNGVQYECEIRNLRQVKSKKS